jgi:plastocyanin
MNILNDVTTALFSTDKLGAIRFVSDDEFEVTSRIYAITAAGTLGQFGPGLPTASAKTRGAILQLKSSGGAGQTGTFRTNIGAVNPNSTAANVTWTLYDRNNARIAGKTTQLAATGVMGPTNMASGTFFDVGTADISDAWVSYSSDQPVFVYASVVDNGTTDQTFVPAVDDKGVPPVTPPPGPTTHEFNVTLQSWSIIFSPAPENIKRGDTVRLNIQVNGGGGHTLLMFGPTGAIVVPTSGSGQRTFTADREGLYQYLCNTPTCGEGHVDMNGSFSVGNEEPPDTGRGY